MASLFRHRGFRVARRHTKRTLYTKKKPPVRKGRIYRVYISDVSERGDGVGKIDNFAVFVPGAEAGETIDVRIVEVKKNCAVGKKISE
jgi:23S rRNA (uracil1939-C5)-methyltransferase